MGSRMVDGKVCAGVLHACCCKQHIRRALSSDLRVLSQRQQPLPVVFQLLRLPLYPCPSRRLLPLLLWTHGAWLRGKITGLRLRSSARKLLRERLRRGRSSAELVRQLRGTFQWRLDRRLPKLQRGNARHRGGYLPPHARHRGRDTFPPASFAARARCVAQQGRAQHCNQTPRGICRGGVLPRPCRRQLPLSPGPAAGVKVPSDHVQHRICEGPQAELPASCFAQGYVSI